VKCWFKERSWALKDSQLPPAFTTCGAIGVLVAQALLTDVEVLRLLSPSRHHLPRNSLPFAAGDMAFYCNDIANTAALTRV
jgi:hypothetical protein